MSSVKNGDVVQLKSGGRTWTVDVVLQLQLRIVTMSEGGLWQEALVFKDSVNVIKHTSDIIYPPKQPKPRGMEW